MRTVIETAIFQRYASEIWSDTEREELIGWIAANPLSGDVMPGTDGLRKVRYARGGMGKRGGTRVVYYNLFDSGEIWPLIAYTKAKFDKLPTNFLNKLRDEIHHG